MEGFEHSEHGGLPYTSAEVVSMEEVPDSVGPDQASDAMPLPLW